jgi:molybdate transport system substrate-binding protein
VKKQWRLFCTTALLTLGVAHAGEVSVAVAANFAIPMQKIAARFAQDTGHRTVLSVGATGKLYAQIKNGAPFHVFLAADEETPALLVKDGLALGQTRFTYATGRLVLWSPQPTLVDAGGDVLRTGTFTHLATANPKLAPYGAAAAQVLTHMGLLPALQRRLVQGESMGQTYQFVATGNAALGFVALSQVMVDGRIANGSAWVVPAHLHSPIRQDAVVLKLGKDNPAAAALIAHLQTEATRTLIRSYGYEN